jgi:hypothetical protein
MATQPIDDQVEDLEAGDGFEQVDPALETHESEDIQALAREMGWKPQDEFKGPKEKWTPARPFILKEQEIRRGMRDQIKDLKDTVDRLATSATKQTERALQRQAKEIEARHKEAMESGDAAGVDAAFRDMEALKEEARTVDKPVKAGDVEGRFAADNPWYGTHPRATDLAVMVSKQQAKEGVTDPAAQLEAVTAAVRAKFPELFEDDGGQTRQRGKEVSVNNPTRNLNPKREKGWADLPPDAKRAGEQFAQLFHDRHNIPLDTAKANYAKDYFANQAA